MSTETRLVDAQGLSVSFDGRRVVDAISFHVDEGECLAIVGESGSGKTVTSRALLGLVPGTGEVSGDRLTVVGRDATRLTERDWRDVRGREVGLISQDALVSIDPLRRVGTEVGEALSVHARRTGTRLTRQEARRRVIDELEHVRVPDPEVRIRQYAHELSGGQRQRALVASATINRPRLLIADEPTTALDVSVQREVLTLLESLRDEGAGLLLISHDLAVVSRIADRVAVMRAGQIVETGPAAEVLADPRHEYTRALLAAEPSLHARGARLSAVPRLDLSAEAAGAGARSTDAPVLEARDVAKSFRRPDGTRIRAVDTVSLTVRAGRTIGIVGESGSGKTTLARMLLGLDEPDTGEILLRGESWSGLKERHRRDRRGVIQAVYQDPLSSFDPRATTGAILREALALTGVPRPDRAGRAVELAARVGLTEDQLSRRPLTLSGGQRQRVAIARALARGPQVLVCDEPVSALDVSIQAQVLDALTDVQEQLGLAMVFISHDLGVIQHMCDDVLVMREGVVVEHGAADEVFAAPEHRYTQELLAALPSARLAGAGPAPRGRSARSIDERDHP